VITTALADQARVPEQVDAWATWATWESRSRRARPHRIRHPRQWRWERIVGYVVIPATYVGLLFWATGPS